MIITVDIGQNLAWTLVAVAALLCVAAYVRKPSPLVTVKTDVNR